MEESGANNDGGLKPGSFGVVPEVAAGHHTYGTQDTSNIQPLPVSTSPFPVLPARLGPQVPLGEGRKGWPNA